MHTGMVWIVYAVPVHSLGFSLVRRGRIDDTEKDPRAGLHRKDVVGSKAV